MATGLEAIATGLEVIATRLEVIAKIACLMLSLSTYPLSCFLGPPFSELGSMLLNGACNIGVQCNTSKNIIHHVGISFGFRTASGSKLV